MCFSQTVAIFAQVRAVARVPALAQVIVWAHDMFHNAAQLVTRFFSGRALWRPDRSNMMLPICGVRDGVSRRCCLVGLLLQWHSIRQLVGTHMAIYFFSVFWTGVFFASPGQHVFRDVFFSV